MHSGTLDYYNTKAPELYRRYSGTESPFDTLLPHHIRPGETVLEIGCASGRDMLFLKEYGCSVFGLEASPALLAETRRHHPELTPLTAVGSLPDGLPDLASLSMPRAYDALLMAAVVMHIPEEELFNSFLTLREHITPGGRLILSFPVARPPEDSQRLMILRPATQYELLLQRLGFSKEALYGNNDMLGRDEIEWVTLVMGYDPQKESGSLNQIEHIINRDNKTATYKPALLRALCDTALLEPALAVWLDKNRIALPLNNIASRWVEYYWPLINIDHFIPQSTAEKPGCSQPLAFRQMLNQLGHHYQFAGQGPQESLAQFISQRDTGTLPSCVSTLYADLIKKIIHTIKVGPIVYAKGGDSGIPPFGHQKIGNSPFIILHQDLWQEMVLMGHWIRDSLLIQWATLTRRFAETKQINLTSGEVLDLLTLETNVKRDTAVARRIYQENKGLTCVWSNKSITSQTLAVDHAIPFALRHDNSLWNLLPADRKVNGSKSDKIPSLDRLHNQRDAIIFNWQLLNKHLKEPFRQSTLQLMGKRLPDNWEIPLFNTFLEAMETTAVRCGSERW